MILRLIQRLLHKDDRTGRFGFMDEKNYKAIIEAILFTMGESVELDKLADALELDNKTTKAIIEEMMEEWEKEDRGVAIMELDGAYQMCTRTEMVDVVVVDSVAAMVTKAEIEKIRGVSSDHAVNKLVEYNLVCELGRLDAPGRPLLFGTTEEFLRSFGVHSIEELPVLSTVQLEEFKQEAEAEMNVQLDI